VCEELTEECTKVEKVCRRKTLSVGAGCEAGRVGHICLEARSSGCYEFSRLRAVMMSPGVRGISWKYGLFRCYMRNTLFDMTWAT
jgi:hypothetical protein